MTATMPVARSLVRSVRRSSPGWSSLSVGPGPWARAAAGAAVSRSPDCSSSSAARRCKRVCVHGARAAGGMLEAGPSETHLRLVDQRIGPGQAGQGIFVLDPDRAALHLDAVAGEGGEIAGQ